MRFRNVVVSVTTSIFLLLPIPTTAAIVGQVSADSMDLQGATIGGSLRGAAFEVIAPGDISEFALSAELLEGYVDVSNAPAVVAGIQIAPSNSTIEQIIAHHVVTGKLASRGGLRILLLPWNTSDAALFMVNASAKAHAQLVEMTYESKGSPSTPDIMLPVRDTTATTHSSGFMEVSGSFQLILWSGSLSVRGDEGDVEIQAGHTREVIAMVPSVPNGVERTQDREAFLNVTNGRLVLPAQTSLSSFSTQTILTTTSGRLSFLNATGVLQLGQAHELADADVTLLGDIEYRSRVDAGRLSGEVSGNPTGLIVDGTIVNLPRPESGIPQWIWVIAWFMALALLYAAYRGAAAGGLHRIERLMARKAYGTAERSAARLKWLPRISEDALVAQAVCLVKLERPLEAKVLLERKPLGRDRVRPARLFLRARIAAGEGEDDEARQLLADCVALAPQFIVDAQADPVLRPFVQRLQSNGGYA